LVQGWEAFNSGDTDSALENFNAVANADASNMEAYLGLGYTYGERNEIERAHQSFGNVISLSVVLLASGDITQAEVDTLLAETYAGKSAVSLAGEDFSEAVTSGLIADSIWTDLGNPGHRWIDGKDLTDLRIIMADAYYNNQDFNQSRLIVEQIDSNFLTTAIDIFNATEELPPTMLEDTGHTGIAQLILLDHNYLIHPVSIVSDANSVCTVDSFEMAGTSVNFKANPIPESSDVYTIVYYYSDDFGLFLIELRTKIDELEG